MARSKPTVLKLANVRLSFPALAKPKSFGTDDSGKPKPPTYQATALLDPTNQEHATIIAAIKVEAARIAKEEWGDSVELKKLILCFGNGDKKAIKDGEEQPTYEAYKGKFYLVATSPETDKQGAKVPPPLVGNRAGELITPEHAQYPYAGAIVTTKVTLFPWNHPPTHRRGISANLRSVQFVKDGEGFGRGSIKADEEFEGLGDEEGTTAGAAAESDPFE